MILSYRPVKTNRKTQGFGESKACVKIDIYGNPAIPYKVIDKKLVCEAGYKDFYRTIGMIGHNGVDWGTWHGEPVYHCDTFSGWTKSEVDSSGGIGVDVVSNEPLVQCTEHGCSEFHYIKRRFWHGKSVAVPDNTTVIMGSLVMFADNTGASSGDHLHTSLKWCDEKGNGIHTDNGYNGAFSDLKFENEFVLDHLEIEYKVSTLTDQVNRLVGIIKAFLKK